MTTDTGEWAPPLRVVPSPKHGLGVFASRAIPGGERVHIAPVVLMSDADVEMLEHTPLRGLVYGWDDDGDTSAAFALGVGSVFNHSSEPNCVYHRIDAGDADAVSGEVHQYDSLEYSTVREVAEGEELTVDYSGGNPSLLWFDPL